MTAAHCHIRYRSAKVRMLLNQETGTVPLTLNDTHEDLARRAAGGNAAALEQLLAAVAPQAAAVAHTITGNPDDALDAAQAALMRIARDIRQWSGSSLRGWVHACAH